MKACLGLMALTLAACQREAPASTLPAFPPPRPEPVIDAALARGAADGLPAVSEEEILNVADLLDLWLSAGRGAERAARTLEDQDPAQLSAALLGLLERLDTATALRRGAYVWLRQRSVRAALPRLTLRLKYEKDWVANVDLALALFRHGSGAGTEALIAILREESKQDEMYVTARERAAAALALLPPAAGWTPGTFAQDWQRLLDCDAQWQRERRPWRDDAGADAGLDAEIWRTLAWLRSQPLRPVDDARFILVRMPAEDAYADLLAAARDADFYVRDHALETLSWIGAPAGRWARRSGTDLIAALTPLLGDAPLRPRVLEALGASALPAAAAQILPWLRGSAEESTAAADGLLRCADAAIVPQLRQVLAGGGHWSPEASFSLGLLCQALGCADAWPLPAPPDLSEAERRQRWAAERPRAE